MRRGRARLGWMLSLTAVLWLAFVPAANAYIDAGSTAVMFQAIVAGLAAAGMFLRVFWRRIVGVFSRGSGADATDPEDVEAHTTSTAEAARTATVGERDAEGDAGR